MGLCVSLQTSLNFHPFYTCSFLLNVIFLFQDHMPPRRVLISGSVLSLQDPCVLYPCCQNCVSRLFINKSGCICKKCGFICGVDDVKYRYRLSFGVARNSDIFGVAVFGSCLDPYFGVSAGFLHRFMEDLKKDAGDMVHTLLIQAVKDCFVGRHFIFGIKLSSVQSRKHSSFGEGLVQTSCSQYSGQFVACQIALPNAAIVGCTVITYLKKLLQAVHVTNFPNVSQQPGGPTAVEQDVTVELNSLECSLAHSGQSCTQWSSGGNAIGPWQQSPGIITSSAEELSQDSSSRSEWGRRSLESHKYQCISKSSNGASLQHVSSHCFTPYKGERSGDESMTREETSLERYQCNSALYESRERINAEKAFGSDFQSRVSSLSDTPRSLLSMLPVLYPQESRLNVQDECTDPCLNETWRAAFSERNDGVSFLQGESSLTKENNYNSLAWKELPFSESLSEFIGKVEREPGETALNAVQEAINNSQKSQKASSAEMHKSINLHGADNVNIPESSPNFKIPTQESTSDLTTTEFTAGVYGGHSSISFRNPPEVYNKENCNLYANVMDRKENEALKGLVHYARGESESALNMRISCDSGVGEKKETSVPFCKMGSRIPRSVIMWESSEQNNIPQWEGCSDANSESVSRKCQAKCTQDNSIDLNSLDVVIKEKNKLNRSTDCTKEDELGIYVTSVRNWDSAKKEHPMQNNYRNTEDVYNASADLFSSSHNSINTEEGVSTPLNIMPLQSSLCVKEHAHVMDHGVPRASECPSFQDPKGMLTSGFHNTDSEFSVSQDFVPSSQSTPISRQLASLQQIPKIFHICEPNHLSHYETRSNLLTRHLLKEHRQSSLQTDFGIECKSTKYFSGVCDSDAEELIPSSVTKVSCMFRLQRLTRNSRGHQFKGNYNCKRNLYNSAHLRKIPSKGEKHEKALNKLKTIKEAVKCNKLKSIQISSSPRKDCSLTYGDSNRERKGASNVDGFQINMDTEVKDSFSCDTVSNTLSDGHDSMTGNWSQDLFSDSTGSSFC
ncbi:DNA damage-induced apoptosis suppressor protein [Lepisosteus oculatus]|uniref:DNA damage-induced apoptosis suppressor protein n=1 Tax=Lepisosteus oculatus TaxID=7918 RepID=UPI00371FC727